MRVIHDTGRNVILENQGKLLKHPKAWARLRYRQEKVVGHGNIPPEPEEDNQAASSSSNVPKPVQQISASIDPMGAKPSIISNAPLVGDNAHGVTALEAMKRAIPMPAELESGSEDELSSVHSEHHQVDFSSQSVSTPLMCGFSLQNVSLPLFVADAFLIDVDWSWDWILQMEGIECCSSDRYKNVSLPCISSSFCRGCRETLFTQCHQLECPTKSGCHPTSIVLQTGANLVE